MLNIEYTAVLNPRATRQDPDCERYVDCDVVAPSISPDPIPFTASADDTGSVHGPEIFARIKAGDFGPIAPYEPTE